MKQEYSDEYPLACNADLQNLKPRIEALQRIFELDIKTRRLLEIQRTLEDPTIWDKPELTHSLGQERASLGHIVESIGELTRRIASVEECIGFLRLENDTSPELWLEIGEQLSTMKEMVEQLEFQRMFCGKMDASSAYMDIQSGSGGTEAQDWAEMLLRLYLRWGDHHGFKTTLMEVSPGDVAGIKSATIHFDAPYAFGWLRTETGVHRLVRKSPFDSGHRRHTSFASVFVSPAIDDTIDIDINPADLRIDTYRAGGAGGQHVNRTDSAVRITHEPTGVVVQCQSDRSQHKNKAQAMKQLQAKLYELEIQKQNTEKQTLEASKSEISWGRQIRSYVLDNARIKDLRTGLETTNTQAVLDGDIDFFIKACLKEEIT